MNRDLLFEKFQSSLYYRFSKKIVGGKTTKKQENHLDSVK